MKLRAVVMFAYGILLLAGGIIGFLKAGSHVSLAMGIITALLAIGCAGALYWMKNYGIPCALTLSILLAIFFAYRFSLSHKFMPGGLMAIISLLVVGFLLFTKRGVLSDQMPT